MSSAPSPATWKPSVTTPPEPVTHDWAPSLPVPLRRAAPPRARRADRPGTCHPPEALREGHRVVPHPGRARGAARRPRPDHLGGQTDRALILLGAQTGLRVSEITGLNSGDLSLGTGAHVRCEGKGRKQRAVPLTRPAQAVLREWTRERGGRAEDPLFQPARPRLRRDAVERRVSTHTAVAARQRPSLHGKRVSPHVLRHSAAMSLLHAGVDTSVIALWLGHADVRATNVYLHADMTIKERALALTTPATVRPGRYRPPDPLLAFLESL